MLLTRLRLRHFRTYESLDLRLAPGVTILHGANGAGKTNVLEAVFVLGTTRSFRTRSDRELISWHQEPEGANRFTRLEDWWQSQDVRGRHIWPGLETDRTRSRYDGETLRGAVQTVLGDSRFRERCQWSAMRIAGMDGRRRAAAHIDHFLEHRDPARQPAGVTELLASLPSLPRESAVA